MGMSEFLGACGIPSVSLSVSLTLSLALLVYEEGMVCVRGLALMVSEHVSSCKYMLVGV